MHPSTFDPTPSTTSIYSLIVTNLCLKIQEFMLSDTVSSQNEANHLPSAYFYFLVGQVRIVVLGFGELTH